MTQYASPQPQSLLALSLLSPTTVSAFRLDAAQLGTLATAPLLLVPGQPQHVIRIVDAFQIVTAGTVAFAAPLLPQLAIPADGGCQFWPFPSDFDGSASLALAFDPADNSNNDYIINAGVGQSLFALGDGNQAGGTGTVLTLLVAYQFINLDGLI